jgi:hypothetical protein
MSKNTLGKKIEIIGDGYCCLRAFFVVIMNATFNRKMIDVDFYNSVDAEAFQNFLDELAELESVNTFRVEVNDFAAVADYFREDRRTGKFRMLPRNMWVGPEGFDSVFCDTKKYIYPPLVSVKKQEDGRFHMNSYRPDAKSTKCYPSILSARDLFSLRDIKYYISYASLHYEVFEPSFTITNEAMNAALNDVWEMFQKDNSQVLLKIQ